MMEKIMKAVKSNNKKRGRNITIGAVVGMLLSCTAVMGAQEVIELEIKKDANNEIKFIKDGVEFIAELKNEQNPYPENIWDGKTYTNNSIIFVENVSGFARGLRLSGDLGEVSFKNNGLISAKGKYGYGIYNYSSGLDSKNSIGSITNSGSISSSYYGINNRSDDLSIISIESITNSGSISGEDAGMYNYSTSKDSSNRGTSISIGNLTNSGSISGGKYGIFNQSSWSSTSIGNLTNSESISGAVHFGIENYSSGSTIENLTNSGSISGGNSGIYNYASGSGIESLINSGVIYGKKSAIKNASSATISNAYNYGLLVSSEEDTLSSVTLTKNLGLIFKDENGTYKAKDDDDFRKFGQVSEADGYIVVNAKAKGNKDDIKGTESLTLKDGTLLYADSETEVISSDKKYVLNGIEDTLKITGRKNELNNSTVNAYKTAVVMNEDMSMLTLDNTVINGNVLGEDTGSTVSMGGIGSTLTLKGDSVINTKEGAVAIEVTGKDNAVTLEGNAIVNGKMESKGNNILNLYGKTDGSMNMLHDISGFTNMSIDNNVTFFEDVKVTGTDIVTVEKSGVLNLRLKKKDITTFAIGIPEATHAFSGATGMIIKGNSPDEAGTLNFITNGIGKEINVDMENIELENMKIKANSIIDKAKIEGDYIHLGAGSDLDGIVNPKVNKYNSLNKIYKSIYNSTDENLDGLRDILGMTFLGMNYDYNSSSEEKQLKNLLSYLNDIYIGTPYSYSSELSRRSAGMFRDIVVDNIFKPETNKWLIMGGLTHVDGGTKDTYYGQNYHEVDTGTSETEADMKLTGAYMLGKYGYSENLTLGITVGGNKSEAEISMSKVKGNSGYLGAFAENYRGNLTLKAGEEYNILNMMQTEEQ